jgi:hypothetical protein
MKFLLQQSGQTYLFYKGACNLPHWLQETSCLPMFFGIFDNGKDMNLFMLPFAPISQYMVAYCDSH